MKRIIFEKLTVNETAHIHGALLNVSYTDFDMGSTSEGAACSYTMDNTIDCGNPSIPQIECANTTNPSGDCSMNQL